MPASKVQLTGGSFQDSEGNLLSGGYLTFKLNQDCQVNSSTQVCSGIEIEVLLDGYGSVIAGQFIWGNDQLSPVNSFYKVTGYKANGQFAWGPNNQQVTGSGGTFDVGTWVPNSVFSWTPSPQSVLLETNGTQNSSQTLQNIQQGSNVTISESGGTVTIAASAAPTAPPSLPTPDQARFALWQVDSPGAVADLPWCFVTTLASEIAWATGDKILRVNIGNLYTYIAPSATHGPQYKTQAASGIGGWYGLPWIHTGRKTTIKGTVTISTTGPIPSGHWKLFCSTSGVTTTVDTGLSVTGDQQINYTIVSTGGVATLTVNGVVVATCPTVPSAVMEMDIFVYTIGGGSPKSQYLAGISDVGNLAADPRAGNSISFGFDVNSDPGSFYYVSEYLYVENSLIST